MGARTTAAEGQPWCAVANFSRRSHWERVICCVDCVWRVRIHNVACPGAGAETREQWQRHERREALRSRRGVRKCRAAVAGTCHMDPTIEVMRATCVSDTGLCCLLNC
eukprot:4339646-Prymnesium_polylepis.1